MNVDIPILKIIGKKLIFHFWGSDIRPKILTTTHPKERIKIEGVSIRSKRIRALLPFVDQIIVATPDLKKLIPNSKFIPVAIDFDRWSPLTINHQKTSKMLDQFLTGWYGSVSIEGMITGKPVLCYNQEDLEKYCPNVPIVNTGPDNLYNNLKTLIKNSTLRKELGIKGREYVKKVYSSEMMHNN